jgi:AcrR family transcriptional regulator
MVARAAQHQRTRERILEAAAAAVRTTTYDRIRIADVASAAGVTAQTVHLHFGSKDALYAAAAAELGAEALALRGRPEPGDVPGVVRALVRQYERDGDGHWRIVSVEASVPVVAEMLQVARQGHRAWLDASLAPLLRTDAARRQDTLDALVVVTEVSAWKTLRRDLGCSATRTAQVMGHLVQGALETGVADPLTSGAAGSTVGRSDRH